MILAKILVLIAALMAAISIAAGPKTHQYVSEAVGSAYSCGSVFPDWGTVSGQRDLSTVAHTEDFRLAYGESDDFIRGITSHVRTDNLWDNGFKKAAMLNDRADEVTIETATDIFLIVEHGAGQQPDWSTCNIAYAVAAYHALGYSAVTERMVYEGLADLSWILTIERWGALFAYPQLRRDLPWTHENYYQAIQDIIIGVR